ncbi:unnamed protein product [Brachionus calyciflorus]|uniref:DNA helicase n=1 Tax=Brachionus calyciflorus TaxID=104777 RepID=A0A813M2C4_9BILA|nr:unnamed protein product [Brachionus calyciflorus]
MTSCYLAHVFYTSFWKPCITKLTKKTDLNKKNTNQNIQNDNADVSQTKTMINDVNKKEENDDDIDEIIMKFGVKLLDSGNIEYFTHIISTVSKLCSKTSNDKACALKLTTDTIYFILPEFAANNIGNGGTGRTSFWMSIDPKSIFDFYICEGKSVEDNTIMLEIQPESLLRALKSSPNMKMVRIKLTKRQIPCITVEIDLHSMSTKSNSRTITHDIPIKVISSSKLSTEDFQEPNINNTTLSIQMPPIKILKHMIERLKCLSDFVFLEATDQGTLTFKIEADAVSVCSYFRNLTNLPIGNNRSVNRSRRRETDTDAYDEYSLCTVRLSLKRLSDFINALQFQPNKIICNFVNNRYAHFFVVHNDDLVLQFLISSMDSFSFINKQLELIELEKNAEIEESKELLSNCSLQRLQIKGLCLLKLKIEQKYTGLYGRTILVFQTAVPNKIIDTQHFSSGDIVSISENSLPPTQLNNVKNLLTGTVTKVNNQSVSVAIDNEIENVDENLNESETYKLIKLCNDVTHKRIKNALVCVKENKCNERSLHLLDVLFQNVKPEKTQSNFSEGLNLNYFNSRLDESQQNAVKFTFEQKDLAIIHGPPGTGKTTTLVEIIKQNCLRYKQKILICAPSNIAVDNLVERLAIQEKGFSKMKLIRLGHPARLLEKIQEFSLDSVLSQSDQYKLASDIKVDMDKTLKQIRKSGTQRSERESLKREMRELRKELYQRENRALKEVLKEADCILATLTTTHEDGPLKHLKDDHFDIIIIDECSQALEASCWIPILKGARKLILAGDHLQLPPTIMSKEAAKKGLDLTLMKRLIDTYGDDCTKMLTIQYRMNKLINNWISDRLYESKLVAHQSVAEHLLSDLPGIEKDENTSTALVLIDTEGCDMPEMVIVDENSPEDEESKANDGEANIVCKHVSDLIKSKLKQEEIAVITPYNLQVELIKAKLHTKYPYVEVKSVDGFQGREKEAVVLSLVRSNSRGEVGFLADERRINVAITRARRHLCVVGDSQTCKNNPFLKSFLDYCEKYADVRSGFDYESNNSQDYNELEFEDIKFSKLRIKEFKPKTNETTKPNESKNQKKKKDKNPVQIESEEDKKFHNQVLEIAEKVKNGAIKEHVFSSELNARQRRIVHEVAEKINLFHESQGNDENRFIKIFNKKIDEIKFEENKKVEETKVDEVEEDTKDEQVKNSFVELVDENETVKNKSNKKKNKNKKPTINQEIKPQVVDPPKPKKETTCFLLGEINDQNDPDLKYRSDCRLCPWCKKFILNSNYTMHELHCSKVYSNLDLEPKLELKNEPKTKGSQSTGAKSSKIKKNPIENAKTDDFDELLTMFQKSNDVCNFQGCKVLVKTLGQNCEFCRNRFCLKHSLAEMHGCGDEARAQARAHIRKTGNLQVNEKQSSYSEQIKRQYNEKKFHEKLESMRAARTGADKKKDKNS